MTRLAERLRAPLVALRGLAASPDLRRIQLAFAGSELGSWIAMIALSVISFSEGGLTSVGLVLGLRLLPPTISAPFMGVLADRLPRRRVMITADLTGFVLVLGAATVVFVDGSVVVVYVITSLVAVASTAFRPAQAALLPSLARTPDELTASNAVSSTTESVMSFAGPALGGVLVAATSVEVAFLVTAGTFLWSTLLLLGIQEPARRSDVDAAVKSTGILAELGVGARTIVGDRRVALLVGLIAAQVVVSGALLVLLTGVSFDVLEGDEEQLGLLLSAMGIGGVLGAAVSLALVGSRLARSFAIGVILWGVPIALLAAWQTFSGAFVLVGVVGFANTLVDVAAFTLLQRAVPDDVLARVFGILESVLYGATVAGALAAPALVGIFGLDSALVITGLFLPILVAATWPALRHLDEIGAPLDRVELLQRAPFLALLPPTALEHLAGSLESVTVPAGEAIFREGEEGDRFYVVEEGEVVVEADGRRIHEGGAGYYFGEIALLRDEPRMATVTARTDTIVLALARDEFQGAVTGHSESAAAADAVIASRLHASRPALLGL
jgi:MFS family permease